MHNAIANNPVLPLGFISHSVGLLPSPVNKNLYSTFDLILINFSIPDGALEKLGSGQYVINDWLFSQARGGGNYNKL